MWILLKVSGDKFQSFFVFPNIYCIFPRETVLLHNSVNSVVTVIVAFKSVWRGMLSIRMTDVWATRKGFSHLDIRTKWVYLKWTLIGQFYSRPTNDSPLEANDEYRWLDCHRRLLCISFLSYKLAPMLTRSWIFYYFIHLVDASFSWLMTVSK